MSPQKKPVRVVHATRVQIGVVVKQTAGAYRVKLEDGRMRTWRKDNCRPVTVVRAAHGKGGRLDKQIADEAEEASFMDVPDFLVRTDFQSTPNIQIKVYGVVNKTWRSRAREFSTIMEARSYLTEVIGKATLTATTKDGRGADLSSGLKIWSNYPLHLIRRGKKPTSPLRVIIFDVDNQPPIIPPRKTTEAEEVKKEPRIPKISSLSEEKVQEILIQKEEAKQTPYKRRRARQSGELIPLKKICQELKFDPRDARKRLRSALKKGLIETHGRWEFSLPEVKIVKELLGAAGS